MAEPIRTSTDANWNHAAHGVVVEARLDRNRGPVSKVLVQDGTVNVGDMFYAGSVHGRVRAMLNLQGQMVKSANAGTQVEVLGLTKLPTGGDEFYTVADWPLAAN